MIPWRRAAHDDPHAEQEMNHIDEDDKVLHVFTYSLHITSYNISSVSICNILNGQKYVQYAQTWGSMFKNF